MKWYLASDKAKLGKSNHLPDDNIQIFFNW